jgi:16S rRNA processing protein RimM
MGFQAYVPVGRVARLHGLKGDLVVLPADEVPFFLEQGMRVWFVPPPLVGVREGAVSAVRETARGFVVHVAGIEDSRAASPLIGTSVSVQASDVPEVEPPTAEGPIGLEVVDVERGVLGCVDDVIETGANDVWVVTGGRFGQVLIPVIDDVVLDVDEEARSVKIRLLPGLIEE